MPTPIPEEFSAETTKFSEHQSESRGRIPERGGPRNHDTASESLFSLKVLNAGFLVGLVLAGVGLISSSRYLFLFLSNTTQVLADTFKTVKDPIQINSALATQMDLAHLAFVSSGVIVGLSVCFVGFSLFLVGAKGDTNAEGNSGHLGIKLSSVSPGTFVIFCGVALIAFCIWNRPQTTISQHTIGDRGGGSVKEASDSNRSVVPDISGPDNLKDNLP